jgi:protein-tyrosine sulfotransferase
MIISKEPTFVVCHPRSGSTLMRYILDTHEDICCPPELHLSLLIEQLTRINSVLYDKNPQYADPALLEEKVHACVRQGLDEIMGRVCREYEKKQWCEKSVSTVDHLPRIKKIYPRARYICLSRHCLDFVHSALETLTLAWGFGYEPYIMARNSNNVVDSLVAYWCEKTRIIMDFGKENRDQCLPVKYESMVNDPEGTSRQLFEFLELNYDSKLLGRVFQSRHYEGPGDSKILTTNRIEKRSVGLGRKVKVARILPATLAQMNFLLKALGYETVDANWSKTAVSLYGAADPLAQRYAADKLQEIFEILIPARLAKNARSKSGNTCVVHINDVENATWLVDFDKNTCSKIVERPGGSKITLGFETLLKLVKGEMNGGRAIRDGAMHLEQIDNSLGADIARLF